MYFPSLGKLAVIAAAVLPFVSAAPTAHHHKIRNAQAKEVIPNSYIIVYHENVSAPDIAAHELMVSSTLSKRASTLNGVGHKYNLWSFKGYQIEADTATINQIANSPEVAYVELDGIMKASTLTDQSSSTWGLARISHTETGFSDYVYDTSAGSGSYVYVVDTGIYIGHSEFGGRATWGKNFVSGSANTDENGHGTHCSGTIGGKTYGVSKNVKLVAVKVLDASGSGSNSGVIAGIQFVATDARSKGISAKTVLSMSLGGGYSSATNSAVANTVSSGVTVVVAAGNSDDDASNYSPASEPSAITVGATDSNDNRASFSNYGSLLDIWAPGVNVLSSWIGSTSATNTISGTSMATPHVAGLAAYLIALEGLSSPSAIVNRIQALATTGHVNDLQGSIDALAYNGNGA